MHSKLWLKIIFSIGILLVMIIFAIKYFYFSTVPKTFRIYYDKINSLILVDMTNYDINIVEASFFTKDDVDIVHLKESKVIGYLSLVEIGYWDTPLVNDLQKSDYLLDSNNEKLMSLSKKNYLGDLTSQHYRSVLMKYLKTRILDKGMDGVFFDTLDWVDYYYDNNTVISSKIIEGYELFLKELKQEYPEIIIIQNRGFISYELFSKEYISGILWENFNSPYLSSDVKKIEKLKTFKKLVRKNKTDVFVISFENEEENRKLIDKLGWNFIFSQMENRYSKWDILYR